ncbi:hypothetical protein LCGC14_1248970 [marine sediment metagenome]|uniref:Uncharacterized protein n=1 Tax=marine sediment metagenome TaxID=412755 RepID=A0A0F9L3K3_9ZZZZ
MLSTEEKINILASGKLALVDSTIKAIEEENKGRNGDKWWTNSWNLMDILITIQDPKTLLNTAQINTLYEKLLDFKYLT